MGSSNENSAFFPARNPWDAVAGSGGFLGRLGGGGRLARGTARDRDGHRRLRPPARGALRARRMEAHVRGASRATASSRSRRPSTRPERSRATSATPRARSRSWRARTRGTRRRSRRAVPDAAAGARRRGERAGASAFSRRPSPPRAAFTRRSRGRSLSQRTRSAPPGAAVTRVSVPRVAFAVPVYYLTATAEASSNLARFDGARYGARAGEGSARRHGPRHALGGVRGRGEAPDPPRDLRALVGLPRRLLRPGAEGACAPRPRLRGRVPRGGRHPLPDLPRAGVPSRREDGRPARDVPRGRVHGAAEPRGAPRGVRAGRLLDGRPSRSACSSSGPPTPSLSSSRSRASSRRRSGRGTGGLRAR